MSGKISLDSSDIPTNLDYAKFRRDFGGYKH